MFNLINGTETTVDLASQVINTFEELMFAIRTRLVRKEHMERNDSELHVQYTSLSDDRQRSIENEIQALANYQTNIQIAKAYCNAMRGRDWNIGAKLWAELSTKQREMVTNARNNGRENQYPNPNQNKQSTPQNRTPSSTHNTQQQNNQTRPSHLRQNTSILRSPSNQNHNGQNRQIPQQYTHANKAHAISSQQDQGSQLTQDDITMSKLECMVNELTSIDNEAFNINRARFNVMTTQCRVNLQYISMLSGIKIYLSIIDGGADTYVVGKSWMPMYILGPQTPKADVIGFDDNAARKHNLPIGPYATNVKDTNGKEIIMYAKHAVGNESSDHTLLCSFHMREIGIIIDDVSSRHINNTSEENGTQSVTFKDETIVDLRCRSTLMSFDTTLHTEKEIATLPVYEIAMDNWDPKAYIDDPINMPLDSKVNPDNNDVSSRLFHSNTQIITTMELQSLNNTTDNSFENYVQLPSNYMACYPKQVETNAMKVSHHDVSDGISILTYMKEYYDLDTILDVPNITDININYSNIDQNYIEYKNFIKGLPDDHSVNSNSTQFFDCQENAKPFH